MAKIALIDNASTFGIVVRVAAALSVVVIARFFYRLYQVRMLFRDAAQKYGIVGLTRMWSQSWPNVLTFSEANDPSFILVRAP